MNSDRIPAGASTPTLEADAYDRLMNLDDTLSSSPGLEGPGTAYDEALNEN